MPRGGQRSLEPFKGVRIMGSLSPETLKDGLKYCCPGVLPVEKKGTGLPIWVALVAAYSCKILEQKESW